MSFFEGTGQSAGIGNAISLIDAVYRWCECVQGQEVVDRALKAIGDSLGSEALAISRVRIGAGATTRILAYDAMPANAPLPRLQRSFAVSILSDFLASARPGTVWLRSAVEVEADPALELFHSRRNMRELAIVPLATEQSHSDFLEIHFVNPLTPGQHAVLNSLAMTLSEAWRKRSQGIFVSSVLSKEDEDDKPIYGTDLLGHRNPARLSRAEFRICLLLTRGVTLSSICDELSIARSTLRTHLRNIYAKTATENLPDLLYLLLRKPAESLAAPQRKIA
jgi:DNA-binding CsgD family transcriptional regulator